MLCICASFEFVARLVSGDQWCGVLEPWTGTDTRRPINIYGLNFRDSDECIFQWTWRFCHKLDAKEDTQGYKCEVSRNINKQSSFYWQSLAVISCYIRSYQLIMAKQPQQMSTLAYSKPSNCQYPSSCPILCSFLPGQLQWCSLNVSISTALSSVFCDPWKTSVKTIGHRFLTWTSALFCINLEIALNPSILKNSWKTFWWYPVVEATSHLRTSNAALQVTLLWPVISCCVQLVPAYPP